MSIIFSTFRQIGLSFLLFLLGSFRSLVLPFEPALQAILLLRWLKLVEHPDVR
jgi:hypothetical protein